MKRFAPAVLKVVKCPYTLWVNAVADAPDEKNWLWIPYLIGTAAISAWSYMAVDEHFHGRNEALLSGVLGFLKFVNETVILILPVFLVVKFVAICAVWVLLGYLFAIGKAAKRLSR